MVQTGLVQLGFKVYRGSTVLSGAESPVHWGTNEEAHHSFECMEGFLAISFATFMGGYLAFFLPSMLEHIPINFCCLRVLAGMFYSEVSLYRFQFCQDPLIRSFATGR